MSNKLVNNLDRTIVTAGVISSMFGYSERWVRQLADDGIIDRLKSGSYELIPTTQKYINHLKLKAEANIDDLSEELDLHEEKTLHEKAKREIAEIELALMKGEVHKGENIKYVMTDMLSRVRTKLLGLPSKLSPMLVMRDEASQIKNIMDDEIYDILTELADYSPELFRGDEYIELEDKEDVDVDEERI